MSRIGIMKDFHVLIYTTWILKGKGGKSLALDSGYEDVMLSTIVCSVALLPRRERGAYHDV